jgi:hypothetical protein
MAGNIDIGRQSTKLTVTILNGEAVSGAFWMGPYAGGYVLIPTSWTDANMGFQVSEAEAGTYVYLRDDAGAPVQISTILTSGARAYALPAELFGCMWVKLWSKSTTAATETDNNQTGDISPTLVLKG